MDNNSLWHEVTGEEKEQIKSEAQMLLQEFSKKLASIEGTEEHFESDMEKNGQREEGSPWKTDGTFKDLFLLNAPLVEDDYLVTEKGGWKK